MFHRFVSLGGRLRRSAYTFVFALVAGALIIAISEGAYHESAAQLDVLAERGRIRVSLLNLVRRITDAESGQRGYMLTGRPEYLAPYEFARRDALAALESLRRSYATLGTPGAEQERAALAEAIGMKLSEIDEVLKLYEQGRAQAAIDLLQTGIGRDQMERIRSLADAMLNDENARMSIALGNVYGTLQLSRIGVASMTVISLIALAMFLQQRRLLDRHRLEQQALMQAERDRLEEEVQRRTHELTELARHLQTAREDERARLARELHDELGALLTAAKLDVARIRPKLQPALPDLMPRLTHLTKTLDSGIALKRRIIEDLRPSSLSNLGLKPALEILCAEFGERLGVPVDVELEPLKLGPAAELTVFRIVQESLTNIGKYARATQIRVSLEREGDRARVRVADDGVGFDPDQVKPATHGLLGMRYRVEAEGGELRISSAPGSGTVLSAWLPIEPSLQPSAEVA